MYFNIFLKLHVLYGLVYSLLPDMTVLVSNILDPIDLTPPTNSSNTSDVGLDEWPTRPPAGSPTTNAPLGATGHETIDQYDLRK